MPIDLSSEQRAFQRSVEEFCRREAGTREQRGTEPHHPGLYRRMADLGWLGVPIPEEFGGAGGGMVDLCLFLETTARMQAPVGGFTTSIIVAAAHERFGSPEQKKLVLGGVAAGSVEAIAMSEPGRAGRMQMMGGYGYSTGFDMERLVRASLVSTVYGGTSEIQREIIGRTYGL
jgi:isovaleryl-CoA dehydrogenase